MKRITIYTDGACSGNPGPGGWGAVLMYKNESKELSGYEINTTNNRMEITAAIEALNSLKSPCAVDLYTDSSYLKDGITKWIYSWLRNDWRTSNKKEVKNAELWKSLLSTITKHEVEWHWVRSHNGNEGNERADKLATSARDKAIKSKNDTFC